MKLLILTLVILISVPAYAKGPVRSGNNWIYLNEQGQAVKNELISMDGEKYYFGSDGYLARNRLVLLGGDYYCFEESGKMVRNGWKKLKEPDGKMYWFFFTDTGKAFLSGWLQIGTARYHFTNCHMDTGWYREDTGMGVVKQYYLGTEDDGRSHEGWLAWKDRTDTLHPVGWYYFRAKTGEMVCDCEESVEGNTYAFNADGTMAAGFCTIISENSKTVTVKYFDPATGRRAEGWLYLEGEEGRTDGWYFFIGGIPISRNRWERTLTERIGIVKIDGYSYGFDENGRMVSGSVSLSDGSVCIFAEDGRLMTAGGK